MKRLGFEIEGQPDQDLGEPDLDKHLGFSAGSPAQ
jgi:hypothetical protein